MNDMDHKALMSSEIFREYLKTQTKKIAKVTSNDEEQLNTLDDFRVFEREVRASPKKLAVFRALQQKFQHDPDYAAQVDSNFADAVMMLDLT